MLWARTPFAWFRRSDQTTIDGFDRHNPDYLIDLNPPALPAISQAAMK